MIKQDVYVHMYPDGKAPEKCGNTIEISAGVIADYDVNGKLIGVEVLGADRVVQTPREE
jgi:uncharacterized protein YuzE